jgi:hypothetical protein
MAAPGTTCRSFPPFGRANLYKNVAQPRPGTATAGKKTNQANAPACSYQTLA